MKALVAVSTALFLVVAGLSAVPLSPVEAECPGTNQIFASHEDVSTNPTGEFEYTLLIGWALTFDPFLLRLELADSGYANIIEESMDFTPNDVTLSVNCVSEEDIPIQVNGELDNECMSGSSFVEIFMTAGFPFNKTAYWGTEIPPKPTGCP